MMRQPMSPNTELKHTEGLGRASSSDSVSKVPPGYVGVVVVSALVAALVIGIRVSASPIEGLVEGVAILFLIMAVLNPRWIIHALLVVTFTTKPESFPDDFSVGGLSVHYFELFLVVAVGYVSHLLYRNPGIRSRILATPGFRAAAVFGLVLIFGALAGVGNGFPFVVDVQTDLRTPAHMLCAVLVAAVVFAIGDAPRYVWTVIAILYASAGMIVVSSLTGLALSGRSEAATLYTSSGAIGESSGAVRYLTETTPLSLATLLVCATLIALGRSKPVVAVAVIPALTVSFLGFSRNEPLTVVVTMAFVAVVALAVGQFARTAKRMAVMLLLAVAGLAVLWFAGSVLGKGNWIDTQVSGYTDRVVSGLDESTLAVDASARDRLAENKYIFEAVEGHEILGLGLGAQYKPPLGEAYDFSAHGGRLYAHNFYLWTYVKLGFVGVASFIAVVGLCIAPAFDRRRLTTSLWCGSAALSGLLLTISVAPMPIDQGSSVLFGGVVGMCIGAAAVTQRVRRPTVKSSSPAVGYGTA